MMKTDGEVLLRGGPASLPAGERRVIVDDTCEKVKVLFGAGYEHFERIDTAYFDWTMRTKIAE